MNSSGLTPVIAPPPGIQANFTAVNPLQTAVIAALTVCIVISTCLTGLRFYAQIRLFSAWIWPDLWILVAWASHMTFAGLLLALLPLGAGHHLWDIPVSEKYRRFEFLLYVNFIVYGPAVTCAKVAILLQLDKIFAGVYKGVVRWGVQIVLYLNVLFYISVTVAVIFECIPRAKAWDATVPGHCVNEKALLTSSGPANLISDFLIFFLPVWAIWHLQMPFSRKFGASAAFTIGLFGCTCSAIRLTYNAELGRSGDLTYIIMQNQLWANAEITIAMIIANIIILPRFFRTILAKPNDGSPRAQCPRSKSPKRPRIADPTESIEMGDDSQVRSHRRSSSCVASFTPNFNALNQAEHGISVTHAFHVESAPRCTPEPERYHL